MGKWGRILVPALAAGLLVPAAAAGAEGGLCRVLVDPSGDPSGVANPLHASSRLEASRLVDVTALDMGFDGATVVAEIAVADLGAEQTPGAEGVEVTLGFATVAGQAAAVASRDSSGWTFSGAAPSREPPAFAVTGAADVARDVVRLEFAAADAGAGPGGALEDLVVTAAETRPGIAMTTDVAPDWGSESFALDGTCRAQSSDGQRCLLALDPVGDNFGRAPPGGKSAVDPATDITALRVATNASTIVVELALAGIGEPIPDRTESYVWEATLGGMDHRIWARATLDRAGRSFAWWTETRFEHTEGVIDPGSDQVVILIPRDRAGAPDGTVLSPANAYAWRVDTPSFGNFADATEAPGADAGGEAGFTAGAACPPALGAPLVADAREDAGVFLGGRLPWFVYIGSSHALDLEFVGAEASADTITLSARVADLSEPPPIGFARAGYTISWYDGAVRWWAQAVRGADGVTFAWGAEGSGARYGGGHLSGPMAGGTLTTGSMDAETGLVSIDVPRAGAGAPSDGVVLSSLGATSWALAGGNTVAWTTVADTTQSASYTLGDSRRA